MLAQLKKLARAGLSVTLLSALVACGRPGEWDARLNPGEPVALHEALVYPVPGFESVVVFRPNVSPEWVSIGGEVRTMVPTPDDQAVLVLDDARGATWIPLGVEEAAVRYTLGADFDEVAFSPTGGHRAVLYFSPHGAPDGRTPIVHNPNEIAILDLDAPPGPLNPTLQSLRAFGEAPQALVVGPETELMGFRRQLVWVLSSQYVTLLDVANPSAPERTVHLLPEGSTEVITPNQVLVGEVDTAPMAFIRAEGSEQVYALSFEEPPARGEIPRPALNLLVSGRSPSDMVLAELPSGSRLISVNSGDNSLAALDPTSGRRVQVQLPHAVRAIRPFVAQRPGGDEEGAYALLWAPGASRISVADLDVLEGRRGQALTTLSLPGAVLQLEPLPELRRALAWVDGGQLVVLDLDERTATPLTIDGQITELVIDAGESRAYATVQTPNVEGGFAVVGVDLGAIRAVASPVPAGAGRLHLMSARGESMLAIDHESEFGRVSFVPAAELGRTPFETRTGFMLDGVLER